MKYNAELNALHNQISDFQGKRAQLWLLGAGEDHELIKRADNEIIVLKRQIAELEHQLESEASIEETKEANPSTEQVDTRKLGNNS